jgi:hypothetical protein
VFVKKSFIFAINACLLSANLYAQEPVVKPEIKTEDISYLRFELIRERAGIDDKVLTANGLGVSIDNYFVRNRFGLSGYTLTYKKYLNYDVVAGHFFGGKVFREFKTHNPSHLKIGGGFEWGTPSGLYDKTYFVQDGNGDPLSYKHFFENRNSNVPYLKPHHDAVWHTFVEAGVIKRGSGVVNIGIRVNVINFGVDGYRFSGGDFISVHTNKIVLVPSLFISFGLKM